MKFSTILIPSLFAASTGFSMLAPRHFFPQRFGKYLEEIDEMFEKDWPSTFMEKQLEEFKDMIPTTDMKGGSLASFKRASPRYEVIDDSERFEVKVDVPGFNHDEIEVGLRAGGRILTVTGHHEVEEEGRKFQTRFQQNFSLDPSILTEELSADFQGEKLIVSAPRKVERLPESRTIPIKMINAEEKEGAKIEGKHEESHKVDAKKEAVVKP
jgi:HSP20 family molecular chaperone IbpA